jgi:hypothetical protein
MPPLKYDEWRGELDLLRPVRSPLDSAITELCRRFASMSASERTDLRRSISMDEFYTLLAFARRAAVFGMREGSIDRLRDGLAAVALIESERVDVRDIGLALSILSHATRRIGKDADTLFRDAAVLAEARVATLIERAAQEHDLRPATGYHEVETKYGIGLIGWGLKKYEPTYDFVSLAIEVAELVEADRYHAGSVQIATELPPVWFETAGSAALDAALRQVRAGATVSGTLRPGFNESYREQWLAIFLVELPDTKLTDSLRQLSENTRPSTYSVLGLAKDRLFCLVVGRSVRQGVPSYETPTSIRRFEAGLEAALSRRVR